MNKGRAPEMPWYTNDWLGSLKVAGMSLAEQGAYFRLLNLAWNHPACCLPDDDAILAQMSLLGEAWHNGSGQKIRACFQYDPDRPGKIYNARQRQVLAIQNGRIDEAREKSRKMNDARWGKQRQDSIRTPQGVLVGLHKDSPTCSLGSPSSLVPRPSSEEEESALPDPQGVLVGEDDEISPPPTLEQVRKGLDSRCIESTDAELQQFYDYCAGNQWRLPQGSIIAAHQRWKAGRVVIQDAQEIYDAYPRKGGRPGALKAIQRALARHPKAKLLEAVEAFCQVWQGATDKQHCALPATWFNDERFNDDPSTWSKPDNKGNSSASNSHPRGQDTRAGF